ncbi:galactose mutarotase-like domain-containing protein [Lobosporangium transversale]|uniref:Galactose mutarotase-like domain-containing protein n=1 Tax=Lobosporangium transversale TaxID=64571 RepID=A0A1Y2GB83_9FUNG|nr:galactose mutarotase-like domain-containing protein [Lobosporangium transversale]ORZ05924.1 galactose mutarotase-like domain-containing protein [Lobosporangium transversale]|eukprot:XP_021877305.1 galactose mutarotase-like domain-containing protein [Lobosporangium transversale]
MACQVISLGATLTHLWVLDNTNSPKDIVLGFDDPKAYRTKYDPYFGATVGRTANRIAQGEFSLPDNPHVVFKLDQNNGPNSLHGGIDGFSHRNWDVVPPLGDVSDGDGCRGTSLRLSMVSEHMDQGFPGRLRVYCTYRLLNSSLEVEYEAYLEQTEDLHREPVEMTIVSLTNHTYFNLNGIPSTGTTNKFTITPITNHVIEMAHIDSFLETDSTSVPSGKILKLDEVPAMDFRKPKSIGDHFKQVPGDGQGYDHFYPVQAAINNPHDYYLKNDVCRIPPTALVNIYSPESGIHMAMTTTEPGFQFYTANFVQVEPNQVDTRKARGGYEPHSGFCLEASKFPNAINHTEWRNQVILRSGDKYQSKTIFTFSIR